MIANIQCLVKACKNLNIPFEFVDKNKNVVKVKLNNKDHFFVNAATPLNDESTARLVEDKYFTQQLLSGVVNMPKAIGVLDPFIEESFKEYREGNSYSELSNLIVKEFMFPLIIKRNSGSRTVSVFRCNTKEDVEAALSQVFNQNNKNYDYVALAQEFIDIKIEYRVITLNGEVEVIYSKGTPSQIVTDPALTKRVSDFLKPVFENLPIRFAGLDIALDNQDKLWLIEINSRPAFNALAKINEEKVVGLYEKILKFVMV